MELQLVPAGGDSDCACVADAGHVVAIPQLATRRDQHRCDRPASARPNTCEVYRVRPLAQHIETKAVVDVRLGARELSIRGSSGATARGSSRPSAACHDLLL